MDKNLRIFISYRRSDNPCFAERIRDWFTLRYARENVFMDFDAIPPFVKFEDFIMDFLRKTDVVLVIIGHEWMNLLKQKANEDEPDYVKLEIMTALQNKTLIAPICVDGAPVPDEDDLPEEIRAMLEFNVAFLQGGRHFLDNIERLIDALPIALAQHQRELTVEVADEAIDVEEDEFVMEEAMPDLNPPAIKKAIPQPIPMPAPSRAAVRRPYIAICNVPADEGVKRRLVNDLESAGYDVRIEDDALPNASLVLILFSPDARRSGYISGAITEAQTANVPLIPVIAAGDMSNALPYSVSAAQMIHLEDGQYDAGLQQLKDLLPSYLR